MKIYSQRWHFTILASTSSSVLKLPGAVKYTAEREDALAVCSSLANEKSVEKWGGTTAQRTEESLRNINLHETTNKLHTQTLGQFVSFLLLDAGGEFSNKISVLSVATSVCARTKEPNCSAKATNEKRKKKILQQPRPAERSGRRCS